MQNSTVDSRSTHIHFPPCHIATFAVLLIPNASNMRRSFPDMCFQEPGLFSFRTGNPMVSSVA